MVMTMMMMMVFYDDDDDDDDYNTRGTLCDRMAQNTAVSSRNIKREHLNGKMILTLFMHTIVNIS